MAGEATIGEFLIGILPRLQDDKRFPLWPPDCFARCLALLRRTGAYAQLLRDWPPDPARDGDFKTWTAKVRELGAKWRKDVDEIGGLKDLAAEWQVICQSFALPLSKTADQRALCEALMTIAAVSDESCEGVGAPKDQAAGEYDPIQDLGADFLAESGTLCSWIDPSRLRVLPRMHTPQNGLTERSLSHYLCLCDASEVTPQWLSNSFLQADSINLLLIPWPFEVPVSQFRETADATDRLPKGSGFFTFSDDSPQNLKERVETLHVEAKRKLGRIDGVVLPELSITNDQFRALRKSLPEECLLIAGVGGHENDAQRGINEVWLSFPPHKDVVQRKHHPWKLDESQVIQYGLGGVLSPERQWWEHIDCTGRRLNFISISENLAVCALVCEDLARPDPVANIVRAVGPNLVIALLMDGPQTKERWAARYATVLADDPGCSVLSLTSLGMAQLSRPQTGPNRSRVVALWKDHLNGATEIELPPGNEAIAVSLSTRYREEFTADGRGDRGVAAFPILSGVHPIGTGADTRLR